MDSTIDLANKEAVENRRLQAENAKLRKALEHIANMPLSMSWQHHFYEATKLAREALQGEKDE